VKGTLVIHLTAQWTSEVTKFLGNTYKVLTIEDENDLAKFTIREIEKADIVVSFLASLFVSRSLLALRSLLFKALRSSKLFALRSSSLFALISSLLSLRSYLFALRSSLFALRSSPLLLLLVL
jgi:hypothetical protein